LHATNEMRSPPHKTQTKLRRSKWKTRLRAARGGSTPHYTLGCTAQRRAVERLLTIAPQILRRQTNAGCKVNNLFSHWIKRSRDYVYPGFDHERSDVSSFKKTSKHRRTQLWLTSVQCYSEPRILLVNVSRFHSAATINCYTRVPKFTISMQSIE